MYQYCDTLNNSPILPPVIRLLPLQLPSYLGKGQDPVVNAKYVVRFPLKTVSVFNYNK